VSRRRLSGVLALAALIAGGVIGGLGAGGSASAGTRTRTAGTTTNSTFTQPVVTVVRTTTTPNKRQPGYHRPTIVVGDMNTPEQFVLGALYSVALSQAGYNVNVTRNIGVPFVKQSLKDGSVDVYPDYLVGWDRDVAGLKLSYPSLSKAYAAGARYAKRHGFELLTPTPGSGSGSFGLAVTSQFARQNHLHSMAGLANQPLLSYGLPLGFGGLWRAERAYGFKAGVVEPVLTGAQYSALASGAVQVAYAGSSDPQLDEPGYTLLADPKHVYGYGNIVPLTTPRVIRLEGPGFVRIINRVDALLTTTALRGLNSEVQLMGHDQTAVAEQFLAGNGLLPPNVYKVVPSG
jgi:osmoprotectant transport system substrate-binding protein